jgi:hypothetical protein
VTRLLTNPNWPGGFVTGLTAAAIAVTVACHWPRPAQAIEPALMANPITAPAVSEGRCSLDHERDSEQWWDCFLALETERCIAAGWCGTLPEVIRVSAYAEVDAI